LNPDERPSAAEVAESLARWYFREDDASRDEKRRTRLHRAAAQGDLEQVTALLSTNKVLVNAVDEDGKTPLLLTDDEDVMEALLNHHPIPKPNKEPSALDEYAHNADDGRALYDAARYGHSGVVKLLLRRGNVDVDARNELGQAPLHLAVRHGHANVVKMLLQRADINVNVKDSAGASPLHLASDEGHIKVTQLLLERKDVDVNVRNDANSSPIQVAARKGHVEIVQLLKRSGTD